MTSTRFLGESPTRVEDTRILTGAGRYIADTVLPDMLHTAFVRSSVGHGRVLSIDADRARALPGVVAVLVGSEINAHAGTMQLPADRWGDHLRPTYRPMATDRVRHVGDPVALVVAESRYIAEDAIDLIDVEIEPLAAVSTIEQALDPSRPALFEELGTNVVYHESKQFGDPDAAFAGADHVLSESFRLARVCPSPMETRGCVADYDRDADLLTFYCNTQSPHTHSVALGIALARPPESIRVIAGDIGGAFGQKSALVLREEAATCVASIILGRPVMSVEDRSENLTVASQAREETLDVEVAFEDDGTVLALGVKMAMSQGAYPLLLVPSALFAWVVRVMMPGPYRIEHMRWDLTVVNTTKATYSAYRGPWAVEALVREVMLDRVARAVGLSTVQLRANNLLRLDEQPRKMITGPTLAAVTGLASLERAAELADLDAFRAQQAHARETGRRLGIGFATFTEAAPGPPDYGKSIGVGESPPERIRARLEPDGHLTVITSQSPNGQGHQTTLAQVAATEFGLPLEHVHVVYGDTAVAPPGSGTSGSRAGTMASGATLAATRVVRDKMLDSASEMLEIAAEDLEVADGLVVPRGAPALAVPVAEVAARSYQDPESDEPGFASEVPFFQPGGGGGWSGGTHVCTVEVDPGTGMVRILRYIVVEDCGGVINPAIVAGQVRGGVAQGIGIALLEDAAYDSDGNFLTPTYMDYLLPTAIEIPAIEIEHLHVTPLHEVDYRGVGEGGTVCAPPAVANAISDALGGAPVAELPLSPERILRLLDAGSDLATATSRRNPADSGTRAERTPSDTGSCSVFDT